MCGDRQAIHCDRDTLVLSQVLREGDRVQVARSLPFVSLDTNGAAAAFYQIAGAIADPGMLLCNLRHVEIIKFLKYFTPFQETLVKYPDFYVDCPSSSRSALFHVGNLCNVFIDREGNLTSITNKLSITTPVHTGIIGLCHILSLHNIVFGFNEPRCWDHSLPYVDPCNDVNVDTLEKFLTYCVVLTQIQNTLPNKLLHQS